MSMTVFATIREHRAGHGRRARRRLVSLLAVSCVTLVSGSGCARFHARPLAPEQTAAAFRARTLRDPGLRAFLEGALRHPVDPWPPAAWDVPMLTLAAWYYHSDLSLARATSDVATAGIATAGAWPNPQLGVSRQFVTDVAGDFSPWVISRTVDLPIETAGKRRHRIAKARGLADAARLQMASSAWQVRSRVRAKWLDVYAAAQEVAILSATGAAQEQYSQFIEERLAAGEVSPMTVTQTRIARAHTTLALQDAQQRLLDARGQLADALGVPAAALETITLSFDSLTQPLPAIARDELERAALLGRPDLLAALAEYAASQAALQLEIAKQYPDLHLGPGYSWDQGTDKWTIGIALTLPIFDQNQGPIAEAQARRTEAAARVSALQAKIIGELDRAVAEYRAAVDALRTADALLADGRMQFHFAQQMTQPGELAAPARWLAQAELDAVTLARLHALVHAQRAFGLLEDAVQRPVGSPEIVTIAEVSGVLRKAHP